MTTQLHILSSTSPLTVEESPHEAAEHLWDSGRPYAELKTYGHPVLVNPATVTHITSAGETQAQI